MTTDLIKPDLSDDEDAYVCAVCLEVIKHGDLCSTDIDLGTVHAECGGGSKPVDLETGEPLPDGATIATFKYEE